MPAEETQTAATEELEDDSAGSLVPVGAGVRVAAAVIDLGCIVAISFAAWRGYAAVRELTLSFVQVARFVNPVVALTWYVTGEAWDGRTLGKLAMGIRVVRTVDGRRPGLARALGRHLASLVSGLPCGLGYLWMLWSPSRATWHDTATRTTVIRA
jgi:uncharacterized RDD family membrane protein YckC